MDEQLNQLNDDLDTQLAQVDDLTNKGDVEGAKSALVKAQGIKGKIEGLQTVRAEANAMKSWRDNPVGTAAATARDTSATPIKQAGAGDIASKGKVGETVIDIFTGNIVKETGLGVLTEQQYKATLNPDYSEGFVNWVRAGGQQSEMKGRKAANDAFLTGRESEGSLFVPAELMAGIISREPTPTRIVDKVRTITVGGDRAQWVRANYNTDDLYSSAVRVFKTGEAGSSQPSDKPQFGLKSIDVHGWTAYMSLGNWMLADANFDIMAYIAGEFRTAMRNMTADKILNGSGVREHFGIITRAGMNVDNPEIVKSGDANLLTWDSLRKIKNKVPEQYDTNCSYLFNKRSTLDTIEGFKDEQGRDLWPEAQRAGGENGAPGRLRGYSYALEAFMPDIAANKIPLLFGDFRGYARVFRAGMSMRALDQIRALDGQTVFLVEFREGGDVVEPWRLKALKVAA